ncbi:MAG: 30S ribosomal protein S12 methylthiotransferase RimO [Candidatus Kapabacteria bacterium]|nr:30S ribosomal protein S12 methylthiotransferase RimO [Candidatus Kapabacteria bacterium]
MKVHIITLGCSKNTVDSETLAGHLTANNMELAESVEDADTLVINTCGFIDTAKEESVNTILEAAQLRKDGSLRQLVVAGCLSERYGDDLRKEIPEVDHFFGTEAYEQIIKAISPDLKYSLLGDRILSTPQHFAYLKISEGCDNPCSFCAIPIMRGTHRSTPIETLVKNAQNLVSQGVKEIVLVAQDLTYYGLDIYEKRRLADLLTALSDESGAEWIRCMYAYPAKFPLDILPVIRDRKNICNYLDMPLQHASTNVLKNMRRGITRRATEELLDQIRQQVPDITLRSTFIIGYPSETEADVDELMEFLQQQQLDRVGVFKYSQEDDTYAYILGDPIPDDVKDARVQRVMELQGEISLSKNLAKIGSTQRVLIEEDLTGEYRGRTESDAPEVDNDVYVRSERPLSLGSFVDVTIDDAAEFDIFGQTT